MFSGSCSGRTALPPGPHSLPCSSTVAMAWPNLPANPALALSGRYLGLVRATFQNPYQASPLTWHTHSLAGAAAWHSPPASPDPMCASGYHSQAQEILQVPMPSLPPDLVSCVLVGVATQTWETASNSSSVSALSNTVAVPVLWKSFLTVLYTS